MDLEPDGREATEWLVAARDAGAALFAKRLSANDTGATKAHQVGPYIPREIIEALFPRLTSRTKDLNPKHVIPTIARSHGDHEAAVALTWYNNKLFDGTRDEYRLTNWGGKQSPLLQHENTGAICLLAFFRHDTEVIGCEAWVARGLAEEEAIEAAIGPVEPGSPRFVDPTAGDVDQPESPTDPCDGPVPAAWTRAFPDAATLVDEAIARCKVVGAGPDALLMSRRGCEFRLFSALERQVVLPRVKAGFESVEDFVAFAGHVTNRRKARSGRSLELHLVRIFEANKVPFDHAPISEGKKRPDFLFPSARAYRDAATPSGRLRMLGVKTTCKDRWRQVINEADRIPQKHLLTLQQGVSIDQYEEMAAERVTLVVPSPNHKFFPDEVRAHLVSLESFIRQVMRAA